MSEYHDQLRRIFAEHGIHAADGRGAMLMTDAEVEAVARSLTVALTEWGLGFADAVSAAARRIEEALEPLTREAR